MTPAPRTPPLLVSCALFLACGSHSEPQVISSQLPAGVPARAGSELISSESVRRIASSQGVAPAQAASYAISDAVFAQEARARAPIGAGSSIDRAALARSLLEQLRGEAERAGPPSEAELSAIVSERWTELDRPDGFRTIHALVRNDKPEKAAEARALADRLAQALASAVTSEEFEQLAKSVPHEGFELKTEPLPFVTADGRTFERRDDAFVPRGPFDGDFARAASKLSTPGQQSPVTETRFGFHVIRLEERLAGSSLDKAQLPSLLGSDVLGRRAARARRELLERLRQGVAIEVDRAVDELTARPKLVQ